MLRLYHFARSIYLWLPLPLPWKEKLKVAVISIILRLRLGIKHPQSSPLQLTPLDRKSKLLKHISPLQQDGLEIGPLCWPIIRKEDSNGRVLYVDFSTAEKLREKYRKDPNVPNVDEIVETDLLWGNQTLPELLNGRLVDYVIASHVIEHVPDMLGWMREVASVLKDAGILALAIPDKRYTFDYKRDLTSFADLIEAYLYQKRRPSPRDIYDHVSLAVKVDMIAAWKGGIDEAELEHYGTIQEALRQASEYMTSSDYNDVHVNILTPTRFLDLLEIASSLGLWDFMIADFYDTAIDSHEFILSLQRIPRGWSEGEKLAQQHHSISDLRKRIA